MRAKNKLQQSTSTVALTMVMAAFAAGSGVSAQTSSTQTEEIQLEEILVSATRRGQTDITTTPVAISAFTANDIMKMAPRDVGDVAFMVPNFSNGQTAGFKSASYAIRGVGQTDIIVYLDSPVGVTIDDFVVPHIQTQALELFDIEQIEVLRGPQGTLFGKNTTGGVINVRTKRPIMDETSFEGQLLWGSFDTKDAKFAINVPLVENQLALRVSGQYLKSDGYYKNGASYGPVLGAERFGETGQGDGRDLGGDDVFSGRAKLQWTPNEDLTALFQYEMVRDRGDSPPVVNESPAGAVFPSLGFGPEEGDPLDRAGTSDRNEFFFNMTDGHIVDIDGFYLNVDYDFDGMTFNSVTGYREQASHLPSAYAGEVYQSLFDASRDDERQTFQQEFRLSGASDNFNWVAGAFYQQNNTDFCVIQLLGFLDLFGLGTPEGTFNSTPQILCNQQDATAIAGFVDGTYDVSDRLHITAGFRYTYEKKEWAGRHQVNFQSLEDVNAIDPNFTWESLNSPLDAADFDRFPSGVVRDEESWSEPTWRATITYDVTEDAIAYFTYSRGFKSGGYNDQTGTSGVPIPAAAARPTDPEIADSFELGWKASNASNTLRYALTGFYVEYNDAQRSSVVSITNSLGQQFQETRFFNAAKATVKGIEFEGTYQPTAGFQIRGSLGYLDSKHNRFEIDTDLDGVIDLDLSSRPLAKAPEWQASINANYVYNMGDNGRLVFDGSVFYEDDSFYNYSDLGSEFDTKLDEKTLVNASITYEDAEDRYYLRLIGKNLTDSRYRTGSLPVANLWVMSSFGAPRFYGVELGFKFGGY